MFYNYLFKFKYIIYTIETVKICVLVIQDKMANLNKINVYIFIVNKIYKIL